MIDLIGWLGAALCTFSSIPQVIESFRNGNTKGLANGTIVMSSLGVFCMFIYVIPMLDLQLFLTYSFKIFVILVYLKYWLLPRRS